MNHDKWAIGAYDLREDQSCTLHHNQPKDSMTLMTREQRGVNNERFSDFVFSASKKTAETNGMQMDYEDLDIRF
jgi:hypothetical protein